MKVRKLISVSAGTLLLVTSITPILADEVSVMNTDTVTQICQDQIQDSSNILHKYPNSYSLLCFKYSFYS